MEIEADEKKRKEAVAYVDNMDLENLDPNVRKEMIGNITSKITSKLGKFNLDESLFLIPHCMNVARLVGVKLMEELFRFGGAGYMPERKGFRICADIRDCVENRARTFGHEIGHCALGHIQDIVPQIFSEIYQPFKLERFESFPLHQNEWYWIKMWQESSPEHFIKEQEAEYFSSLLFSSKNNNEYPGWWQVHDGEWENRVQRKRVLLDEF